MLILDEQTFFSAGWITSLLSKSLMSVLPDVSSCPAIVPQNTPPVGGGGPSVPFLLPCTPILSSISLTVNWPFSIFTFLFFLFFPQCGQIWLGGFGPPFQSTVSSLPLLALPTRVNKMPSSGTRGRGEN